MSSGRPASSSYDNSFATASETTPIMVSPSVDLSEIALLSVATAVQGTLLDDSDFWERLSCATAEQKSECGSVLETELCTAFEQFSVETAVAPGDIDDGFALGDGNSWSDVLSETGAYDSGSCSVACSLDSNVSVKTAASGCSEPIVYPVEACPEETIKVVWRNHAHYQAMKHEEIAPTDDENTITVTFGEESQLEDPEHFFATCPSLEMMIQRDRKRQRPVSYYQLPELNKGAVDYAPRLINVTSQYHAKGLEDFHAFSTTPTDTVGHGDVNQFVAPVDSYYYAGDNLIQ